MYRSKRLLKNFWQEYRVCAERIELQFWLGLHTIVIPFREIESLKVRSPGGSLGGIVETFRSFPLKIDASDFCRHVLLKRTTGIFKYIRFAPDDPEKFVAAAAPYVRKR